jgi:mannose-6-phosphate isomerase-like protein (cupin superfamily)
VSPPDKVSLAGKLALFDERWSPRIVAELNGQEVKLAKLEGEFPWHDHAEADELFLVLEGELVIRFRDGEVRLRAGELVVVPRGVEHSPVAESECHVLLFEPAGTRNTGDVEHELTVDEPPRA